ncbi:MAG: hypothetical protein B6245_10265 [Desulfobacteraceae bacterium 4572_88]|nr:MAG: hypothetical protein B6245_10265 [Desulfobacteraceae bacterium 4572_88]
MKVLDVRENMKLSCLLMPRSWPKLTDFQKNRLTASLLGDMPVYDLFLRQAQVILVKSVF